MAPVVIRPYRLVGILALALVLGACRLPYVPGVDSVLGRRDEKLTWAHTVLSPALG